MIGDKPGIVYLKDFSDSKETSFDICTPDFNVDLLLSMPQLMATPVVSEGKHTPTLPLYSSCRFDVTDHTNVEILIGFQSTCCLALYSLLVVFSCITLFFLCFNRSECPSSNSCMFLFCRVCGLLFGLLFLFVYNLCV